MFSLGSRTSRPSYGALIDIGSGTVGVGIVASYGEEKAPRLIYTHRLEMRITEHRGTFTDDLRRIREALFSATLLLAEEGQRTLTQEDTNAHIEHLFVTCASPWSYTLVRNVRYENDEEFQVTEAILHDLTETASSEILEEIRKDPRIHDEIFDIVEQSTVDVRINDYLVDAPIGKPGTSVSLAHVIGLIPKELIGTIHEIQDKLFPKTTLRMHTGMLGTYCVIRDIFPHIHSCALINVTGEATECALVENDFFAQNSFIPYGSNTLVREIMERTKRPASDIITTLRLADTHDFDAEIDAIQTQYRALFRSHIEHIREHRAFPNEIVITTHRAYTSWFTKIILKTLHETLGKEPVLRLIDPLIIEEISKGADEDIYLALAARFFHKVHRCGEEET